MGRKNLAEKGGLLTIQRWVVKISAAGNYIWLLATKIFSYVSVTLNDQCRNIDVFCSELFTRIKNRGREGRLLTVILDTDNIFNFSDVYFGKIWYSQHFKSNTYLKFQLENGES